MRASARASRSAASPTPDPAGRRRIPAPPQAASRPAPPGPAPGGGSGAGRPRSGWAGRRPGRRGPGCSRADAALPARRGQRARRLQRRVQRRLQRRTGGDQFLQPPPQAAGARPAALGAEQPAAQSRRSPDRTVRRKTRCPPRRTRGGLRRTRSGSGTTLSSSPPQAAWVITSAWLATTSCAVRARRIVCSTKQRRQCGQAAWMHSPRRSARPRMVPVPNSSASQPGRSPPWMSPSSVTSAQRAIRPSGMTDGRRQARRWPGRARPRGSAGRGSSRGPCAPRRGGAARRDRGTAGPVRRRSGAAGGG